MIKHVSPLILASLLALMPQHLLANHHVEQSNQRQIAIGAGIYDDKCAKCHGFTLAGPEVPENFTKLNMPPRLDGKGHAAHHSDQELFDQIANGSVNKDGDRSKDRMPPFGKALKPDEIWALVAFIKNSWKTPKMPHSR